MRKISRNTLLALLILLLVATFAIAPLEAINASAQTSTSPVRLHTQSAINPINTYGVLEGNGSRNHYYGHSVDFATDIPWTFLSIYTHSGVGFEVRNSNGQIIATNQSSESSSPQGLVRAFRASSYSSTNTVYYSIELHSFASNDPRRVFTVEFFTDSNDELHYALRFGAPILGRAWFEYGFDTSVTRPTTTSPYVTTRVPGSGGSANFVPQRGWIRSLRLTRFSAINAHLLSSFGGAEVIPPGWSTPIRVNENQTVDVTFNAARTHNVRGNWQSRIRVTWGGTAGTFHYWGTMRVEFEYIYGSPDARNIANQQLIGRPALPNLPPRP
jgi:hypothetical protein